jgi:peptidoglycan/LPS O-acetylase OafA/YrhL
MKHMKRGLMLLALLAVGLTMTACSAYVKTYDANGAPLGSCTASRSWFFGIGSGGASCAGSANPKDQK